jgi:ribonuclease J
VITEKDQFVHVSGHPGQEEMLQMYEWLRPEISVPVHGEARNLARHAALATQAAVGQTLVIENGAMVRLAPGPAKVVDHVPVGKLALSGKKAVPIDAESVRARRKISFNGLIVAIIVLDEDGFVAAPMRVMLRGLDSDVSDAEASAEKLLERGLDSIPRARRRDDSEVEKMARKVLRGVARDTISQRPTIEIEILRLAALEPVKVHAGAKVAR